MKEFVQALESELSGSLNLFRSEGDKLSVVYKSKKAVTESILRLQDYIRGHPFADQAAEIDYFKNLAPAFYSRLFYYSKLCQLELERQFAEKDQIISLFTHELDIIGKFYERHRDFCNYYYQQSPEIDDRVFVRNKQENAMLDEVELIMNADFCVGCYWASRLLANNALKKYLKEELNLLKNPVIQPHEEEPVLIWTDSHTDLVELIYCVYLKKSFNNGNASIKELVAFCQKHFGVDLGNYYITRQEILRRKNTTQYIDGLKDASRSAQN